jgi:lysophospholipase L1-like esterase
VPGRRAGPSLSSVALLAVVALVAAAAAVACSRASGFAPTGHDSRRVTVVGDSITFLSANDITAQLKADGDDPTVVGRIGRTASEVQADVTSAAATKPSVILFELGTNDVTRSADGSGSADDYETWMRRYIAQFPDSCLIATTASSHRPSPAMDATARTINTWLHQTFAHVVEWDTYEWAQRQAHVLLVDYDEVHPNPAGQAALAQLDLAAVRSCTQ